MSIADIAEVLGGKKTFHRAVRSSEDLSSSIRAGFSVHAITALADGLTVPHADVARGLRIPSRTLTRRMSRNARLTAEESDRAARMARVIALAVNVLGARNKASSWLRTPNRALGGQTPMEALDTDPGYRQVEETLYAIAYGMYS